MQRGLFHLYKTAPTYAALRRVFVVPGLRNIAPFKNHFKVDAYVRRELEYGAGRDDEAQYPRKNPRGAGSAASA